MIAEKEISIWTEALLSILEGKTKEEKKALFKKIIEILKNRKKEYLLPKILKRFESMCSKRKMVELYFAREQSTGLIKKMKKKISGMFGRDKNIEVKIEKDLIGGFRVKTANFLIKATVKDFLNELKSYY